MFFVWLEVVISYSRKTITKAIRFFFSLWWCTMGSFFVCFHWKNNLFSVFLNVVELHQWLKKVWGCVCMFLEQEFLYQQELAMWDISSCHKFLLISEYGCVCRHVCVCVGMYMCLRVCVCKVCVPKNKARWSEHVQVITFDYLWGED